MPPYSQQFHHTVITNSIYTPNTTVHRQRHRNEDYFQYLSTIPATNMFQGFIFTLAGTEILLKEPIRQLIIKHGGNVEVNVTKKINFVITAYKETLFPTARIDQSIKYHIPLVSELWIYECIEQRHLVDVARFIIGSRNRIRELIQPVVEFLHVSHPSNQHSVWRQVTSPSTPYRDSMQEIVFLKRAEVDCRGANVCKLIPQQMKVVYDHQNQCYCHSSLVHVSEDKFAILQMLEQESLVEQLKHFIIVCRYGTLGSEGFVFRQSIENSFYYPLIQLIHKKMANASEENENEPLLHLLEENGHISSRDYALKVFQVRFWQLTHRCWKLENQRLKQMREQKTILPDDYDEFDEELIPLVGKEQFDSYYSQRKEDAFRMKMIPVYFSQLIEPTIQYGTKEQVLQILETQKKQQYHAYLNLQQIQQQKLQQEASKHERQQGTKIEKKSADIFKELELFLDEEEAGEGSAVLPTAPTTAPILSTAPVVQLKEEEEAYDDDIMIVDE